MNNISHLFGSAIVRKIFTYQDYMLLMEQVVREHRTTGPKQSEEMNHYTNLNLRRMQRLNKTVVVEDELAAAIGALTTPQTWYILTEAWCGDAAQNIPVLAAAAAFNSGINIKLLLRDENPDLMNAYLTSGGRSIPKLIAVDSEFNELFNWGPRAEGAQEMMHAYHANPVKSYKDFAEDIQRWYISDKTHSLQQEILMLVKGVLTEK